MKWSTHGGWWVVVDGGFPKTNVVGCFELFPQPHCMTKPGSTKLVSVAFARMRAALTALTARCSKGRRGITIDSGTWAATGEQRKSEADEPWKRLLFLLFNKQQPDEGLPNMWTQFKRENAKKSGQIREAFQSIRHRPRERVRERWRSWFQIPRWAVSVQKIKDNNY